MAKLVVLYRHPVDPGAFSAYYSSTHAPLAKSIPGLRALEVSSGPVVAPDGSSPYFLVATLTFDSMAAIQAAMSSPEGVATATCRTSPRRGPRSSSSTRPTPELPARRGLR